MARAPTFVPLFYQPNEVMQIHLITLLVLAPTFFSCQQQPIVGQALAANLDYISNPNADDKYDPDPSATLNVIFKSADAGESWQDMSAGLPYGTFVDGLTFQNNTLFVSTEKGLYHMRTNVSKPAWEKELFLYGPVYELVSNPKGMLACAYNSGIFQNLSGTDIWKVLSNNLKDKAIRTAMFTAKNTLLVGTDHGIFKSVNDGNSWKAVYEGGMIFNFVEVDGALIAGGEKGVLRSTDGGETWVTSLYENIMSKNTGRLDDQLFTIQGTEDIEKPNPGGITNRLRVSKDGGKNWQRLENSLFPIQDQYDMDESLAGTKDLFDMAQVGKYLFCSFDTGIYRTADQGKTWQLVFNAKKMSFRMFVSGNVIYAVPSGGC